jgi:uncharacterized protein YbjT (DUF2867 family)
MYAIFGATGNTGAVVARELLNAGLPTRAIVRNAQKAASLRERGAEVVVADLLQPQQVSTALRGVRSAYVMLPPHVDGDDMLGVGRRIMDTVSRALSEASVQHVVLLSSVGAQHDSGTGPILGNHYAERVLRKAVPALTALRPPYFMENWAESLGALQEGKLVTMLEPERSIPMIATEDIGRIAAARLQQGARAHEIVDLEGPRSYSPLDAARALSALTGRKVAPEFVPLEAIVPMLTSFGMGPATAELFRQMYEGIASGKVVHDGSGEPVARGTVPLEEVLRRLLAR